MFTPIHRALGFEMGIQPSILINKLEVDHGVEETATSGLEAGCLRFTKTELG